VSQDKVCAESNSMARARDKKKAGKAKRKHALVAAAATNDVIAGTQMLLRCATLVQPSLSMSIEALPTGAKVATARQQHSQLSAAVT
jgi:hypothetical protein